MNDLYNIKNGASDGKTKYAAIDECIAYTYNTDGPSTRWCMNYVSCYDTAHCSVSGISLFGAVGDYDYCANKVQQVHGRQDSTGTISAETSASC